MSRAHSIIRTARADGGAVLVLFAFMLPVLIGVGGLVMDVGNWFAHKRHLQTQADAGALAGAGKFRFPCTDAPILDEVSKYSSIGSVDAGYNPQIGATPASELFKEINSQTWYDQSKPVDDGPGGVPAGNPGPCAAKMIDVKLTETDLPWFLRLFGDSVPYINTHARVEIRQKTSSRGAIPVGVPEADPKLATAIFVDETKAPSAVGYVIATTPLAQEGTSSTWSNLAAPKDVDITSSKIGVRIAVSGGSSTTCGAPLVACYDAGSSAGVVFIRGWSSAPAGGAATATPPQARDVQLFGAGCEDGYFTATPLSYPCTVNVGAVVDFGGASIASSRVLAKKASQNANSAVALTPPATAGEPWTGGGISIAAGSGSVAVELLWKTGCPVDRTKACSGPGTDSGSIGTVQRTFAASAGRSGPLKLVRVSEKGLLGANSFERCSVVKLACRHSLVVTIKLQSSLKNAADVNERPVVLKVAGGSSQNQALDCDIDPTTNLRDELQNGCGTTYRKNNAEACPPSSAALDNVFGANPPNIWPCVATNQGATVGQVAQGMNLRVFGNATPPATACPSGPNNWLVDFPDFSAADKRVVELFLTPFGAFSSQGDTTVPVTGFATFYVTGWDKGACQGVPKDQGGDDDAGQGEIVGHFIKYIDTIGPADGGDELCDFDALGSCVALFTR